MNTLEDTKLVKIDLELSNLDRERITLLDKLVADKVITIPSKTNISDMGRVATCGSNRIILGGQH